MNSNLIPFFYESINRNAIIVKPKKAFFEWINNLYKDNEPITEMDENNIYLVREMDNNEDVKKWIKKNFEDIFINELNDWHTDESGWPTKRTYKMFSEWFHIEVHSMVLDLEEYSVSKS